MARAAAGFIAYGLQVAQEWNMALSHILIVIAEGTTSVYAEARYSHRQCSRVFMMHLTAVASNSARPLPSVIAACMEDTIPIPLSPELLKPSGHASLGWVKLAFCQVVRLRGFAEVGSADLDSSDGLMFFQHPSTCSTKF